MDRILTHHGRIEIRPLRALKHCSIRWLSLERCVKRFLEQWPALHMYFDRQEGIETNNARVVRVAQQLRDSEVKLLCHFISYAMKPLYKFSVAFQTSASRIGTLHSDVRSLLKSFMSNIVDPDILQSHDDVTSVDYQSRSNQVCDDELGIATSTRLLLFGELEDTVHGTAIEKRFFTCVREFYVATISKMLKKFPFTESVIKELSFLDPLKRSNSSCSEIMSLASRFTSFTVIMNMIIYLWNFGTFVHVLIVSCYNSIPRIMQLSNIIGMQCRR